MKLLQSSVLGAINEIASKHCVRGNKLNCFKATQVLGGPTQILIWGFEIAEVLPDKLREWPGALVSRGDLKF